MLRRLDPSQIPAVANPVVDQETMSVVTTIIEAIRNRGESALREYAEKFDRLPQDAPLVMDAAQLKRVLDALPKDERALLERTAERIATFAHAQRASIGDVTMPVLGGTAGQEVVPVQRAGCYAPGGRFPLPSSVLMTAITARAAGVRDVWVASPNPSVHTIAAASVAGANALLCAGGAQAIAAFAYGAGAIPRVDVIAGPGNRFVTAAKKIVSGDVGIDMLAGPSELVVIADESADPSMIAADLLAQAEHDPDALPVLITTCVSLADDVNMALAEQLKTLSTADTASSALKRGFCVIVKSMEEAVEVSDRIAPEHLELLCRNADDVRKRVTHYGALFVGSGSAEVFGDYGIGPNHTLPTGGGSRFAGGLSVFHFLRIRTWLHVDGHADASMVRDAAELARLEGLEAHARSAEKR